MISRILLAVGLMMAAVPTAPLLALRSIKSYCAAAMTGWPSGVSRESFPTDGAIVTAQAIPARPTASA